MMYRSRDFFIELSDFNLSIVILAILFFYSCNSQSNLPEMILIEGGTFQMGQEDGEADERPIHEVSLDNFYLSKYEVTVADFRAFCLETNHQMPPEPAWGWIEDHPIINTSWNDAVAYIQWINNKYDDNFRLPSEAEFEYVIRNGGKNGVYPWTDTATINENIADQSKKDSGWTRNIWPDYNDGYSNSSPVGSFPSNELGIHDINGNAWEWCSDWYADYGEKPAKNPKGPETGAHKVGRGASYNSDPWHCRSAGRSWVKPEFQGPGFRLAKSS